MTKKIIVLCFVLISHAVFAAKVHLTSLSWPPYSDELIDMQGASVAVAKAAFAAEGHELVVSFFPWSRAVKLASQPHSKYVGYFPEYYFETNEFSFSNPMGSGPLGLLQHKNSPIKFDTVEDLIGIRVGVVQDYVNTKALDDLIAAGKVIGEPVLVDKVNIMKVATGRIPVAVIDPFVFDYLLSHDASLSTFEGKVEMHENLLANKGLFVAFKNDAQGEKWRNIFNRGLAKINVEQIMASYFKHNL